MEIMTNKADIVAGIASIQKRGQKLDADIQGLALATANHAHLHGDVTLLNDLFKALSRGARHSAMTAWLLMFAPVVANTDPASKRDLPFVYEKTKKTAGDELAKLMAEGDAEGSQWFDMKPSPMPDEEFDIVAALHVLRHKANKDGIKIKKGGELALAKLNSTCEELGIEA